jgi:hypothetical protein
MAQPGQVQRDSVARGSYPDIRNEPTYEEIQQRAYYIHLSRGDSAGHELEDWLQAENELKSNGTGATKK